MLTNIIDHQNLTAMMVHDSEGKGSPGHQSPSPMMPNYKLSLASWAVSLKICKELITGEICKYSPDQETVGDTGLLGAS